MARTPFLPSLVVSCLGGLAAVAPLARAADPPPDPAARPGNPSAGHRPVITPNGATLPWRVVDGVKVGRLVAEEVRHEFAPGLVGRCWGYNGRVHGPTIEAVEGDRVRIYVTNRLPAPTTVHWHGMHVPNGMDGVAGLTQRAIEPGETFRYEFTLKTPGTFMYHPHHDEMVQMSMGLMGMFVVHPKTPTRPAPDRDFVLLLSEWSIVPGMERPDPFEMTDFNVLTFNAKVFPATEPLVAKVGDRVRIRIGNLGAMDHHPIHLHGGSFRVVETDGGEIPEAGRWPETTVLVPVGSTRTVEFTAENPGDWAFHCHMTHHTMTQMGHGIPNLTGVDPTPFDQAILDHVASAAAGAEGEIAGGAPKNSIAMLGGTGPFGYVAMGGMFTVVKVRASLASYDDPGWYAHPEGTVAGPATEEELRRDVPEEEPRRGDPVPDAPPVAPRPADHPPGHSHPR
jgi:FtsP/CotA-like multicopper oxidase with cupredoxin domain